MVAVSQEKQCYIINPYEKAKTKRKEKKSSSVFARKGHE